MPSVMFRVLTVSESVSHLIDRGYRCVHVSTYVLRHSIKGTHVNDCKKHNVLFSEFSAYSLSS